MIASPTGHRDCFSGAGGDHGGGHSGVKRSDATNGLILTGARVITPGQDRLFSNPRARLNARHVPAAGPGAGSVLWASLLVLPRTRLRDVSGAGITAIWYSACWIMCLRDARLYVLTIIEFSCSAAAARRRKAVSRRLAIRFCRRL